MNRNRLLLKYLILYPMLNVVGMAVGTFALYFSFSWTVEYARAFFYVGAVFLIVIFYLLNFHIIFQAFFSGNKGAVK